MCGPAKLRTVGTSQTGHSYLLLGAVPDTMYVG